MLRRTAVAFLEAHDLHLPVRADVALFAAGFFPLPSSGPATLDGNILRYDEARLTWEAEVWSLVCARLLQREGYEPTPELCAELARWFGVRLEWRAKRALVLR